MTTELITLERAIANFKNNQTQKNAELLIHLLKEGTFYLLLHPSLLQPGHEEERKEVEASIRSGTVQNVPILLFNTGSEAGTILPVFTNRTEMEKFPDAANFAAVQITFPALYLLTSSRESIDNLLLNPEGNAMAFNREQFLQSFQIPKQEVKEEELKAGTTLRLEQGLKQVSNKTLRTMKKTAARYPEIEELWIARRLDEDGSLHSWLLVVDARTKREDSHRELAQAFLQSVGKGSAAICYADEEAAKDIVEQFEPAYTR